MWAVAAGAGAEVGLSAQLEDRLHAREGANLLARTVDLGEGVFLVLIGMLTMVLFLLRRSNREYLWFSVAMLGSGAQSLWSYSWTNYIVNVQWVEQPEACDRDPVVAGDPGFCEGVAESAEHLAVRVAVAGWLLVELLSVGEFRSATGLAVEFFGAAAAAI